MGDAHNNSLISTLWLRILLFVSLATNLLVAGMMVGAFIRYDTRHSAMRAESMASPSLRELGYGFFGRAMTKEDQRKVGEAIKLRARELEINRRELRSQISTLLNALREVPYDPAAVREITEKHQDRLRERQDVGKELLLEHIEGMSDQERARYADRLERVLRRAVK